MGALLFLATALALYVYSHKEELKQEALNMINQKLLTRIQVQHIGVNLFTQFPRVSLVLNQVQIQDAFSSETPLLQATQVAIGFNIMDIIQKNYRITSIKIAEGEVHLIINAKGKSNYAIIRSADTSDTSTEPFLLNLENISISRLRVSYIDKISAQEYDVFFNQSQWSVSIIPEQWKLTLKNDAIIQQVKSGKTDYIKDKPLQMDAVFTYIVNDKLWQFSQTSYAIADLHFTADGTYRQNAKADEIDLKLNAPNAKITSLLSVLPVKPDVLNDWTSQGNVSLDGYVRGKISEKHEPEIRVQFSVSDGLLTNRKKNIHVEKISTGGELFMNGAKSYLKLQDLTLMNGNSKLTGELQLNNLNKPILNASLQASLDASDAIKWLPAEQINSATGSIGVDVRINAAVKDLSENKRLNTDAISGSINAHLADVQFAKGNQKIRSVDLSSTLKGDLLLDQLNITTDKSDVKIQGVISGFAAMLFSGKQASAVLTVHSNELHIADILFETSSTNSKDTTPALIKNWKINADINKLHYDKTIAEDLKVNVSISDDAMEINDLATKIYGGSIAGNVILSKTNQKYKVVSAQINYSALDVKRLFEECNNFNQKEITASNLSGKLSGGLQLNARMDDKNEVVLSSLTAIADMKISQGAIVNYDPLKKLSRFADVEDLNNLRFADLKNTLLIQNSVITIPEMDIATNALNLTLSGTQAFDGYMDYKIRLKLSELLKRKRKPNPDEAIEEEESGRGTYVFLTMKGYADNLKIAYDKMAVKKKMKQDITEEKDRIKEILKKELGIQKDPLIKEKKTNADELEFEQE
jgi:hypothetical protein